MKEEDILLSYLLQIWYFWQIISNSQYFSLRLLELISEICEYTTDKLCSTNVLDGISNLESAPVCDSNRIKPASLWRSGLAYGRTVGVREGIYPVNYTISDLPVTLDVSSRMSVPWQTDWVAFHIMGAINSNRLPAFRSIRAHLALSVRNNNRMILVFFDPS